MFYDAFSGGGSLTLQKAKFAEEKAEEFVGKSDVFKEQFGEQRFVVHCGELRLRLQANLADDPLPERLDNVCKGLEI